MINMKIQLRGHHLLCLQGFQGYGYSKKFVLNMTRINEMRKSKDSVISLTNESDDICAFCPNLIDGVCENKKQNNLIKEMDNEVLKKLDMNKEYSGPELFDEVASKFNTATSIRNICCGCKWSNECLFYKKLI